MAAQYIPEQLDHLAVAVLAQAIRDLEDLAHTPQTPQLVREGQDHAEQALTWLQSPAARGWLEELEYPTARLDGFIATASTKVLAGRIATDYAEITRIARMNKIRRDNRSRKETA